MTPNPITTPTQLPYWRRSGTLMYRPDQRRSCCPHYTIRLDSSQFKPSRDQRQTVNRFNKYVMGDNYMKEATRLYPKSRDQAKKRDNHFDLVERIHEAEDANLKNPPEAAHKLVVTLEHDDFTEEKFAVYQNYQAVVHKEAPNEITKTGFRRFLCDSPLRREKMVSPAGRDRRLGSYHQCYRLDGKLVAIGVLDLLPECVSSVYFLYHESIHQHAPGKLGALYEIALSIEEGYGWWYPGYYIHSCPKMWYKIDYSPQFVLDPVSLTWDSLDRTVLDLLDKKPFVSLSIEREQASCEDAKTSPTSDDDTKLSDESKNKESDSSTSEEEDDNNWLFNSGMPGIPPISTAATWDMDHIALKIKAGAPLYETSDLVSWDEHDVKDYPGIRAGVAELVAAIGPDLMDQICLDFASRR
ncbi:arginine-tRNA-protein transferase [Fusarium austroafricanum]|uniref:arginyltransferase n=1 Tax=Fusarium austroafricanum TaxID=2364996 RepID=A0A8H4JHH9_9HYPO|nr:arginine-tRNA-protein transferase [Fusarium austroafricanum]